MDLIWRDLSENDERCSRLQLYSETDPGTAATFAVRCNSIIGVTSEENFSNDAMYLVEGVFPDNHTLQQVEMDWSFLQPLSLDERQALIQGVASIPSMQHISIRGGCNVAAAAAAAAQQQQPDEASQTTASTTTSPHASVLNLSLLTLIPERAHATLTSLSIEMAELTISNLNDLKSAAIAFAHCHQLESLHIRGLFLVPQQQQTSNTTNDEEEGGNDNNAQQQLQQQQQQQPQHAGCYDVLLQALATLPKLHILHMSQKEDPNKPPVPTTATDSTTDASSIQQQQQQATITCDALSSFCQAALPRLSCLSLLNMGLKDEHCHVLKRELNTSTRLTSLILIDNPSITESGNALLLQLLQQNRSIFNSTFGTDSDTQYRAQQLTLLHLNRCGRSNYKIADATAADATVAGRSGNTSRHRRVKQQQQQQRPEHAWIQYLTKINETVPEELELDALYCAISENPDFIRHAVCQQTSAAAAKDEDEDCNNDNAHHHQVDDKVKKQKPSPVNDPLLGALPVPLSSPSTPPPVVKESAIPSTITTTTNHHHHHHHHSSSSSLKKKKAAALDKTIQDDSKDDDNNPVMNTTTPTESTCSSVAVSDLSSCGVEDNHDDDDDDKVQDDDGHDDDAPEGPFAKRVVHAQRFWPVSPLPPSGPGPDDADPDEKTDKDEKNDDNNIYMSQFRRLESKLAQRERQLWLREQALQARMRHVLNREADLLQAEARIKAMHEHYQNTTKNSSRQEQEQEQQQGFLHLPAFNLSTLYYKSQQRVMSPQKTKATSSSMSQYQEESEYCEAAFSFKTNVKDSLAVTRTTSSLQPQDSSSSVEGRDDVVQQHIANDDAAAGTVLHGPSAAWPANPTTTAAVAAILPGLFITTTTTSSSQSVSSLLLDLEKQTAATLEHVRDECWNLLPVRSFFQ